MSLYEQCFEHTTYRDDSLNAHHINVSDGGKQHKCHYMTNVLSIRHTGMIPNAHHINVSDGGKQHKYHYMDCHNQWQMHPESPKSSNGSRRAWCK